MNKGSGKINFTFLLNSISILPTKLYTLGYTVDGLYLMFSVQRGARHINKENS